MTVTSPGSGPPALSTGSVAAQLARNSSANSDRGAMKGALNPQGLEALPHVKEWLGHSRAAAEVVRERNGGEVTGEHLSLLEGRISNNE